MKIKVLGLSILFSSLLIISGCNEELVATVSFNEVGDTLGGDVNGDGGSTTRTYSWTNTLTTADYNMDITSTNGGSFNLSITDADGTSVLNETLVAGQGPDSKSGVTPAGTTGTWTVTVTLTDFNGDGSFSLTPGN